jgi:UDP-glucose 4-epimerase
MLPTELRDSFAAARCLVTGGAGFIGSNLSRTLLEFGADVVVLDDFSTGRRDHLPEHPRLRVVENELSRCPNLEDFTNDVDYVFHMAAQVGNVKSIGAPVRDAETNVVGTVRLIEACRRAAIKRFVYSSSSAIFGEADCLPIEEDHPVNPLSFYALSKLTAEKYVRLAAALLSIPTVSLRYFNVYGTPMEDNEYTGVISIFLRRLQQRQPLVIYGDGTQVRDFVYVDDIVQANLRAACNGRTGAAYNIGTGRSTSVAELAELLIDLTSTSVPVQHADFRGAEVRRSTADISRAKSELGFSPVHSLREGLSRVILSGSSLAPGGGH